MSKTNQITIICDNGGGTTLQVVSDSGYRYQHTYDDAAHIATDIKASLAGENPAGWDGNEAEGDDASWMEPTGDEIRNGGYRVYDVDDIKGLDAENCSWRNARELHAALTA